MKLIKSWQKTGDAVVCLFSKPNPGIQKKTPLKSRIAGWNRHLIFLFKWTTELMEEMIIGITSELGLKKSIGPSNKEVLQFPR